MPWQHKKHVEQVSAQEQYAFRAIRSCYMRRFFFSSFAKKRLFCVLLDGYLQLLDETFLFRQFRVHEAKEYGHKKYQQFN